MKCKHGTADEKNALPASVPKRIRLERSITLMRFFVVVLKEGRIKEANDFLCCVDDETCCLGLIAKTCVVFFVT